MIKKIFMLAAAMIMSLPLLQAQESEGLKVMSYNIRLGSAQDGTNSWALRYTATGKMLEDQKPDVFGVQEALEYQVRYIEEMCGYESVGVGRENGKKEGEHMSIFWNKKTVSMLKWGTFWLSDTPEKPSKGWDAECFRTATWALMKDKKTGKKFYFVNTHLDHKGTEAQKNGLKLIVDRIAEINPDGLPMVLTGDFNIEPKNPALKDLDARMQSARNIAEKTDDHATYNGWGKSSTMIDYIYVSGFSSCPEYQTVTKRYEDRKFISDHYPIFARLIF
ncbi:MAG: endonuclease/exonuclease/phosphatase family protein [Bacteroidales bacterium]|nr:endonuclease/exonuclease/phosphatase family protein [Bacteroidales bacterium]